MTYALNLILILFMYTSTQAGENDEPIEEQIRRSAVPILFLSGDQVSPVATAFLYTPEDHDKLLVNQKDVQKLYLISAAHTFKEIQGNLGIRLNFHSTDTTARKFVLFTSNCQSQVDEKADLIVFNITSLATPTSDLLDCSYVVTKKMLYQGPLLPTIYDNLMMVGYGKLFYDTTNNLPLFRWGKLASDARKNFDSFPQFIVDWNALHGSSGAPVFSMDKSEGVNFMGVSCAAETYPTFSLQISTPQSGSQAQNLTSPLNYSYVTNKQRLMDLLNAITF